MAKNSVTRRISPALDSKIKSYIGRAERILGIKVNYIQASAMVAKDVK